MGWQDAPVVTTPEWQKAPKAEDEPAPRRYSRAGALGAEVARPILKTGASLVGMTDPANLLSGRKSGGLGESLNRQVDKYLPLPTGASGGIETASELVLGAMAGGRADAEFAAQEAAKSGAALYRASQFVEGKVGLAWQKLPGDLQKHLAMIARNPKDLAKLDPKLVAQEANSGQRVSALVQSDLDTLATKLKLPLQTTKQAGAAVQGDMRTQLKAVKGKIDGLFDEARAKGEYEAPVDVAPLVKWAQEPANSRNAGWLRSALGHYAGRGEEYSEAVPDPAVRSLNTRVSAMRPDAGVTDTTVKPVLHVTVNDLERVREEANARIFDKTGSGAHYAFQAKKAIDSILDQAGGVLYKTARAAQAAYKNEWVRQGIIRKLSTDKPGTSDPRVALESTIQAAVIRGSAADLGKVKSTLAGGPAWTSLQAGAVSYLREAAQNVRDPTQFNNRFLDHLHDLDRDGKLSILFGEDAADHLRALAQTVRQLHGAAAQPEQAKASAGAIIKVMDVLVGHLPVAGKVYRGAMVLHKLGKELPSVSKAAAKAGVNYRSTAVKRVPLATGGAASSDKD